MTVTSIPQAWKARSTELTEENLRSWLEEQAEEYALSYLLAHADDGVIWGKFQNKHLVTADAIFPNSVATLRLATLQQCRIFGERAEVLLWKQDDICLHRPIDDTQDKHNFITEKQVLWGTQEVKSDAGFTLVAEGRQGLHHAVPLSGIFSRANKPLLPSFERELPHHPLRLEVRHYVDYDEDGVARIVCSRLVNLYVVPKS